MNQRNEQFLPLRSFFSYQSGVSLLLPATWIEIPEESCAVLYADRAIPKSPPGLMINIFEVKEGRPDDYKVTLLEAIEGQRHLSGYAGVEPQECEIDGFPALNCLSRWVDEKNQASVVQLQLCVQVAHLVYCFTCATSFALAETYLPIFEEALNSARFISYQSQEEPTVD